MKTFYVHRKNCNKLIWLLIFPFIYSFWLILLSFFCLARKLIVFFQSTLFKLINSIILFVFLFFYQQLRGNVVDHDDHDDWDEMMRRRCKLINCIENQIEFSDNCVRISFFDVDSTGWSINWMINLLLWFNQHRKRSWLISFLFFS